MAKRQRKTYVEQIAETCPNKEAHTPSPSGYLEWHAWAEEMAKTNVQVECGGCGLWTIWVPRDERGDSS